MDHQAADVVGKPERFLQVGWWKLNCKLINSRYWQSGCVLTGAEEAKAEEWLLSCDYFGGP